MAEKNPKKNALPAANAGFDTPTPKEIVVELDRYIIGQQEAKRMVSIALRNRGRRKLLPDDLRDEVAPKNIIMIGPTGVGKTGIARRLSALAGAPFIKVEASKFTEVGYVGRDVESIIRDLVNLAVNNLKKEMMQKVQDKAEAIVEEKLIELLFPFRKAKKPGRMDNINVALPPGLTAAQEGPVPGDEDERPAEGAEAAGEAEQYKNTREKIRLKLREGKFEESWVEIEVRESVMPMVEVFSNAGIDLNEPGLAGFMGGVFPKKTKKRKMTVAEARKFLVAQEAEKLIDMDKVVSEAIVRTENSGIVFIDEIDKIVGKEGGSGPDISRQGVQRDLLPIVEGSTVMTKFGAVNTNHVLFIAAGAFHIAKPSDLIPELQGRFPIRVELKSLTVEDFRNILTKPRNALIRQYTALLATEGVELKFSEDGIGRIAEISHQVNMETENIGARRLHTIMEKILEDISFNAPDLKGKSIAIDKDYVDAKLKDIVSNTDLSRYIL